eukprot:9474912-Pyramimonas_sp.AAC.2
MGSGVPGWIRTRARTLCPSLADRNMSLYNGTHLLNVAISEVNDWIGNPTLQINRYLDVAELFCGTGGITAACVDRGMMAVGFDRTNGYPNLPPYYILSIKEGGTAWASPECSTWIQMANNTTKRKKVDPEFTGDAMRRDVREANFTADVLRFT